jgi:hypothetical protein
MVVSEYVCYIGIDLYSQKKIALVIIRIIILLALSTPHTIHNIM